jgi:2-(1,2-epoxy-1,2-dihydrophenyl)acetyl-CoA isomerase
MSYQTILFELDGAIARLTLNRPERLNSFTSEMHAEVADALDRLEAAADVRVLLLTGAGRGFCAGQDLVAQSMTTDADFRAALDQGYNPLIRRLTALPIPVVCAVNGVAAGAGANIALACDIVIAARSAKFIQAFAAIGLVPDSGGTWVLPRLVGQARALGLALTGQPLPAEQAEAWGLIWKAVDDDALAVEVEQLVAKFASAATRGLAATKAAIRGAFTNNLDAQLDIERDLQRQLGVSVDYQEGVSAFTAKRSPVFTGR